MIGTWRTLALSFLAAGILTGCGLGTSTPTKTFKVEMPTGLNQAKLLLENYAKGKPLASEASTFPRIVEEVKKTDPQKADLLEKGFADIQKNPKQARATAAALLKKL